MSRGLIFLVCLAGLAAAAADPIWNEIGLVHYDVVERDGYRLSAWRYRDATSALAGLGEAGAESEGAPVRIGNYVALCEGKCPADLKPLLPGLKASSLPAFHAYLPAKNLVARSERYVLGPVGFSRTLPTIPVELAAFGFGTEIDTAKYEIRKNELTLALFSFVTPELARTQVALIKKVPGVVAKRSGPLVGVVVGAADERSAEALLKDIEYEASLNWDEAPPLVIQPLTAVQIVLGGLKLAGAVMLFCVLSGLAYGGFRLLRKDGSRISDDAMITLNIGDS